jgi:hypothetical protein
VSWGRAVITWLPVPPPSIFDDKGRSCTTSAAGLCHPAGCDVVLDFTEVCLAKDSFTLGKWGGGVGPVLE